LILLGLRPQTPVSRYSLNDDDDDDDDGDDDDDDDHFSKTPLFEELRRTSRESFELDSTTNKSWDVRLNSSKSGALFLLLDVHLLCFRTRFFVF